MPLHIVILAAGKGTRMKSALPKVLHSLAGKPLLGHVLDTAAELSPEAVHVVVGFQGEQIREFYAQASVTWVEQTAQLGTGHALLQAMPGIPDEATVLVLYGDVPLIQSTSLESVVQAGQQGLGLLTMALADPSGYGRIIRDAEGAVRAIVEQKDASPEELRIQEVNTGILCGQAAHLRRWLAGLTADNAQAEYYLTDVIAAAAAEHRPATAVTVANIWETTGVNSRRQLAELERIWQLKQADRLMDAGLSLADPQRFDLRGTLQHGRDCYIDVNCIIEGDCVLGDEVSIGPHCVLKNVHLGSGVSVQPHSLLEQAQLEDQVTVGPFARIRPGSLLRQGSRVGNFVELKKAELGAGSKVNHLSYIGDAVVGEETNIGAGTITCNYDGANKYLTQLGNEVFVGSNTALVAPVNIADGATIAAGSTITRDVEAGSLAIGRSRQKAVRGWKRPTKQSKKKD